MNRILKNKGGYILTWVVCFFLVISILSAVAVSVSVATSRTTASQHSRQQAYYTARSVAGTVAEYIKSNANNPNVLDNLINNQGHGTISNMGSYTVDVSYISEIKIKILVKATYLGETDTVSAYLVRPPAPSGIIPTDNVVFVNGDARNIGQCKLNGNIYINGDLNFSQGSSINGYAVVKGTATFSGAGSATSGLFSFGNVHLHSGSNIKGDLHTKGDLFIEGNANITGSAYADGSLDMPNGTIEKNAVIANNVHFAGGAKIWGSLSYGGNVTYDYGSVSTFVLGGSVKINDYQPIDSSPYTSPALPKISVPDRTKMPELYNSVVIENKTITSSGTITPAVVSQLNQLPYGTSVIVDATKKDINLLLDNTHLNLTNGVNIEIESDGTHNVFIYMTGDSSISVNSNEYVGMRVRSTNPRLFIIGDGQQQVSLNNNSELDACVYIPEGTINASGSPLTTYKFVGTCIVKNANINSNVLFHYSRPDLKNTPLEIFESGNYGNGQGAWMLESWDNK